MTVNLRPPSFGPLELKLPHDPDPCPGVDWEGRWAQWAYQEHQDWEDRLNPDHTWGIGDIQAPGGSGIAFGYSQPDLAAVRVATRAWKLSPHPNPEHLIRDGIYAMAGFDMTHEVYFARAVQSIASRGASWPWFSLHGQVVLDNPSNRPQNFDCLWAQVQAAPHTGLQWTNLRALGWTMYLKAAEHKCARALGVPIDTSWMARALDILELAAIPETGQIAAAGAQDSQHPLDQLGCEDTFHRSILDMGAMACARRLHRPLPPYIIQRLNALAGQTPILYYGAPSLPNFTYTVDGKLVPATGPGQQGDPGFGWWSSVCVAVASFGDPSWLEKADLWGPTSWNGYDEQVRKFTMLRRGSQM